MNCADNLVVYNECPAGNAITVAVPECDTDFMINPGESVAKAIAPGYHTLVFTSEGRTDSRPVMITDDGKATKVYVSRAEFGLNIKVVAPDPDDVPFFLNRYNAMEFKPEYTVNGPEYIKPSDNPLPTIAILFSVFLPVLGLILAIVDCMTCRNKGIPIHKLTKSAFIVGSISLVTWVFLVKYFC